MGLSDIIYLDNHASTPCDPRVVEAMLPFFADFPANPASTTHALGRRSALAVEQAREKIASLLGTQAREVFFTSGATESNNIALFGMSMEVPERKGIVSTAIEHKSISEPCRILSSKDRETIQISVGNNGVVDIQSASEAISEKTAIVAVHLVNNEIGTIQPIAKLARIAHEKGAWLHCDAAQAVGRIPVSMRELGADSLALSGHKMYGPKGIGCLVITAESPVKASIQPLFFGGGQEHGLRPGTLNVPGIVGLGEAASLAALEVSDDVERIGRLRDLFFERLSALIPGLKINGVAADRVPGNASIVFPDVDAELLLANLPNIAASFGSACNSGSFDPSPILTAIGLTREEASRTIRFGLGRFSLEEEIIRAVLAISEAWHRLRED